jgi:A118 family predicted phage portal protein
VKIEQIIEYLNKEYGYDVSSSYYSYIREWDKWWRGYYKPFHHFTEVAGTKKIERDMYTLKMGKKVCEDWASILLNEKTEIVIKDKSSNDFIQGTDQTGGVFGENKFWMKANALVEKAFYSGTGAIVLRMNGMVIKDDLVLKDPETQIVFEYLPALNIIPLTVQQGRIIDVAFVSEVLVKGKKYFYLEKHIKEPTGYQITNEYLKDEEGVLKKVELPEGIIESYNTGTDIPLFAIITPNIVNNIDDSTGLGISVYADAIDCLKGVDLAFNNFCRDFKLGGKKVFINDSLIQRDENGVVVTPDDVAQQLFVQVGDSDLDEQKLIQEFNPTLRVDENKNGIQGQLDYLSFKCGLGTKHYQFNAGSVVTATQYMGDKQELIQNASKHYIIVEQALQDIVRAVLWCGKEILGQPVNPDTQVTVTFDDSYIIDKESERLRDQAEVRDGLMQKWEYRVKWYGEDETKAKQMAAANMTDDEYMGFGGGAK